jgi:DNA-binding phage protein
MAPSSPHTPSFKQAGRFIKKAGGVPQLAALLGMSRISIYKWLRPTSKGGTDGLIPTSQIPNILFAFDLHNIKIDPMDWNPQ